MVTIDLGRAVMELWPHLKPVHHLPGRLRLQLKLGGAAIKAVRALQQRGVGVELLEELPGVRIGRLNPVAGSLLLEYDTKIIPFDLVDAFFGAENSESAEQLLPRLLTCGAKQ